LLLFGNFNFNILPYTLEIFRTMKWATAEYITILSSFNGRHQAADQDQREDIVNAAKLAITTAAKTNGVDAPAGLVQVTPIWVAFKSTDMCLLENI
jgi:hypothetical protein